MPIIEEAQALLKKFNPDDYKADASFMHEVKAWIKEVAAKHTPIEQKELGNYFRYDARIEFKKPARLQHYCKIFADYVNSCVNDAKAVPSEANASPENPERSFTCKM